MSARSSGCQNYQSVNSKKSSSTKRAKKTLSAHRQFIAHQYIIPSLGNATSRNRKTTLTFASFKNVRFLSAIRKERRHTNLRFFEQTKIMLRNEFLEYEIFLSEDYIQIHPLLFLNYLKTKRSKKVSAEGSKIFYLTLSINFEISSLQHP